MNFWEAGSPYLLRIKHEGVDCVIMDHYDDNMIRTQISLDQELYESAKTLAKQKGISLAELFRRSLAETVQSEPNDKPWMAYAGIVEGNPEDSSTVDEVVYGRETP